MEPGLADKQGNGHADKARERGQGRTESGEAEMEERSDAVEGRGSEEMSSGCQGGMEEVEDKDGEVDVESEEMQREEGFAGQVAVAEAGGGVEADGGGGGGEIAAERGEDRGLAGVEQWCREDVVEGGGADATSLHASTLDMQGSECLLAHVRLEMLRLRGICRAAGGAAWADSARGVGFDLVWLEMVARCGAGILRLPCSLAQRPQGPQGPRLPRGEAHARTRAAMREDVQTEEEALDMMVSALGAFGRRLGVFDTLLDAGLGGVRTQCRTQSSRKPGDARRARQRRWHKFLQAVRRCVEIGWGSGHWEGGLQRGEERERDVRSGLSAGYVVKRASHLLSRTSTSPCARGEALGGGGVEEAEVGGVGSSGMGEWRECEGVAACLVAVVLDRLVDGGGFGCEERAATEDATEDDDNERLQNMVGAVVGAVVRRGEEGLHEWLQQIWPCVQSIVETSEVGDRLGSWWRGSWVEQLANTVRHQMLGWIFFGFSG